MINYRIIPDENLMFCQVSGNLQLFDFNKYVQQLMQDINYKPELKTIIKISKGTTFSYRKEAEGIQRFFSLYIQQRKGAAWAIVVPDKTTQVMTDLVMQGVDISPINLGYFSSEEEARYWLLN